MFNKKFEIVVPDAGRAVMALRTYGLDPKVAAEVVDAEASISLYDYATVPQELISPKLIEFFGEQHIKDAVALSYYLSSEWEMTFTELIKLYDKFFKDHTPESLILDPSNFKEWVEAQ